MSAKNKKLLAVLGAAAVVVIVIAAVLLGKGGQTTTVDPASTPSDVSAEDVDSSNTPDSSSSEPLVVVPDTSKPEATDSQNQTDAVLNVDTDAFGVEVNERTNIKTDVDKFATNVAGVFAAGDFTKTDNKTNCHKNKCI